MAEKTQKKLTQEVHQAVLGIEGTDEKGISGDIKELKDYVKKQNGRIRKVEITLAMLISVLMGAGILEGVGVIHLFGG